MKAILFDLDNTLYNTRNYYLGAFQKISNYLSTKYSINQQQTYDYLERLWKEKSSMYSHLFDDVVKAENLGKENIPVLIKIFNEYEIKKEDFYEDVIPTLKSLAINYKIGVITDGTVSRQNRKLKVLDIKKKFDTIVFTKNIEPKPSSKPYLEALNKIKISPELAVYLGDNPLLDFRGAKEIGMKTIRIQRGEFANVENNNDVDYNIKNLFDLQNILNELDCE